MIQQSGKHLIRVLHMIASLEIGGSQTMVLNMNKAINREHVQFDFILDHPDRLALKDEIERLGGKIYILPTFTGKNLLQVKKAWDSFFINHPEYKILHTHSRSYASVYLPIAKKHGLITIAHSHSTSNGKGIKAVVKNLMQFPIRYQADYLFACSQEAAAWLFGKKAAISGRCFIIPNAIDSRQFRFDFDKRKKIRKELGIAEQFVVGHTGRLTLPKNHVFLFRCFKELLKEKPDALLLLVGDGELRESLEREAKQLEIYNQLLFLGEKTNVADYYKPWMPSFFHPCGKDWEWRSLRHRQRDSPVLFLIMCQKRWMPVQGWLNFCH